MNAVGRPYSLPGDRQGLLAKAKRLEWISLGFLLSIVVLMGIVMGSSQTMKALWVEDALSLVPSCSFLVGAYFRKKRPDEAYPYGYRRAVLVGFMCGAVTLLAFGLFILGDSVLK